MMPVLSRLLSRKILIVALAVAALGAATADSSNALVIRTAMLKSGPSFGTRTVTVLPVGTGVETGTRVGGWQKVTVISGPAEQSGWLRTYQLRNDIATTPALVSQKSDSKRGVLSGLDSLSRSTSALFGRRELEGNSGNMTATIGVRGLSEADLKNASPNAVELQQLKVNAVSDRSALQFAQTGGLKAEKIKELPKPKK